MKDFAILSDQIHSAGGVLRGVVSQSQKTANKAMADWKIPFPSIGDPTASIAENIRKRDLLDIDVDAEMAEYFNKSDELPGGRHGVRRCFHTLVLLS